MKILNITLALLTLAVIGAVVVWDSDRRSSPGPLHPAHSGQRELKGNAGCDACHGDSKRPDLAAACSTCHTEIGKQIADKTGLHGAQRDAARCGRCHVEHHGSQVALVDDRVFALAGVKSRAEYDHAHVVGFGLDGAHDALACDKCHRDSAIAVLPTDHNRFLGLEQKCSTCHRDPHEGALGQDCASCHGQQKRFDQVGEFRHKRFAIDGAHAQLACVKCHQKGSEHGIESLRDRDPEPRRCADCHGDPHGSEQKALPLAAAVDCASCHRTTKFAEASFGIAEHANLGVRLEGAHAKAACASCHTAERAVMVVRDGHVADAMTRCSDCHAPAHDPGGNALPLAKAVDCASCHDVERFAAATFGVAEHAARGIDLVGAHQQAECRTCHTPERAALIASRSPVAAVMTRCTECHASPHTSALAQATANLAKLTGDAACALCHDAHATGFRVPEARVTDSIHAAAGMELVKPHTGLDCKACHVETAATFAARFPGRDPERCGSCHTDPHGGQFDRDGRAAACTSCHMESTFRPSHIDVDGHADHGFPLLGAHRAVACDKCHTQKTGEPRAFAGTARSCDQCHADPHEGRFDRQGMPKLVGGRDSCARCHQESDFLEVRDGFDHKLWTGFALNGKHADATCVSCHGRSAQPDARGRTLGHSATSCADCHADVHAGQLARGAPARTDCARCHDDNKDFHALHFDHARDTRFALDDTHARLECAACHRQETLADGRKLTRYRPLGRECTDCHGGREVRR